MVTSHFLDALMFLNITLLDMIFIPQSICFLKANCWVVQYGDAAAWRCSRVQLPLNISQKLREKNCNVVFPSVNLQDCKQEYFEGNNSRKNNWKNIESNLVFSLKLIRFEDVLKYSILG